MNRTVVSGIAAFALLIGAGLAMQETTAEAGHCGGGLFAKLHAKKCGGGLFGGHHADRGCGGGGLFSGHHADRGCSGGLLARLRAKHAAKSCCAPEPVCCEPAPAPAPCCEPAPAPAPCCEPAPAPCCEPAPAPCCEPAPAPCCGGAAPIAAGAGCVGCEGGAATAGVELAPGETLVPGSVKTVEGGEAAELPASASDAAEEAAPPAPTPDASTDA